MSGSVSFSALRELMANSYQEAALMAEEAVRQKLPSAKTLASGPGWVLVQEGQTLSKYAIKNQQLAEKLDCPVKVLTKKEESAEIRAATVTGIRLIRGGHVQAGRSLLAEVAEAIRTEHRVSV